MVFRPKRYTDLWVNVLYVSVSMDDSLNIYTFAGKKFPNYDAKENKLDHFF